MIPTAPPPEKSDLGLLRAWAQVRCRGPGVDDPKACPERVGAGGAGPPAPLGDVLPLLPLQTLDALDLDRPGLALVRTLPPVSAPARSCGVAIHAISLFRVVSSLTGGAMPGVLDQPREARPRAGGAGGAAPAGV